MAPEESSLVAQGGSPEKSLAQQNSRPGEGRREPCLEVCQRVSISRPHPGRSKLALPPSIVI